VGLGRFDLRSLMSLDGGGVGELRGFMRTAPPLDFASWKMRRYHLVMLMLSVGMGWDLEGEGLVASFEYMYGL
jgi:hypothetical protein